MLTVEQTTVEWVASRFKAPKADLDKTVEVWKVKDDGVPVIIVGVKRKDLIGWAEIWVILTEGLEYHWWSTLREARALVRMAKDRYAGLIAHTKPGPDERFARFFGFKEIQRNADVIRFEL
jgi:hypothetical protein